MLEVVRLLGRAPPRHLVHRPAHRVGDLVGVEDDEAVEVPGRAPGRLDERGLRPQEPLLVGVEDRDERDLGQVEPLAQEVDADEGVEDAAPQVSDDLDPLERLDVGVEVAGPHAELEEVVRQVLGHPLRERRDERPLPLRRPLADAAEEVVDLPLHGPHLDAGVDETRRADDLLHDLAARLLELVRAPGSPRRRAAARPARATPRTSAAGCRGPRGGGSRTRRASPCGSGRRGTSPAPAGASGGSRR